MRVFLLSHILLPLFASCAAQAQTSFEYKGIYSPTNAEDEVRARYATNHVDYDWDLWGHNLKKVVESNPDNAVYATVADTLCKAQFCFSSPQLFSIVENYILDQYGEGTSTYSARLLIMPQDNKLACTCPDCRKLGNSEHNATPAVTQMLCRLAKRFPRHQFFTSSYHSTSIPPETKLPDNVGVFISAIDLPLRVDFSQTKGYRKFVGTVEAWKKVCNKLYVWDYERNYEDYLTPFPCLRAMQSRIKLYRDLGIKGIFLNGSGDEYSAFDDMQTVVLAQMLSNPDIDVDAKVREYFENAYPTTAQLISDYYLALENRTVSTNHVLPLYATMEELVESYLNADEFIEWRKQLDKASKGTAKPERTRLNYLLTALSYTQLQLMQLQGSTDEDEMDDMIEILRGHSELKGMEYYSESYGKIDDYIKKTSNKTAK
ncbi:MAG: DUF4838 domain-containing protein [Bacteroidales bacterium]|nr:DUF4838 domain-containing protein [Candidatus Liminaster caballi]